MIETKDCQICCETFESGGILRYFADLDNKSWCLGHVTFRNSSKIPDYRDYCVTCGAGPGIPCDSIRIGMHSEEIEVSLAAHEQQSDAEFTQRQAEVMEELDGIPVQ